MNSSGGDRPTGENVSIARLRHRPPRKARVAFSRGLKLDGSGKYAEAATAFEHAADLDPEFSEAHGNLGVELTALGKLDQAALETRRAIAVDPATSIYHANLAYILILLHHDREALETAREAVSLDASNLTAQFLLGVLLAGRPEMRGDAELHLRSAVRAYPKAHSLLAQLYTADGALQRAAAEAKAYEEGMKRTGLRSETRAIPAPDGR